DRIALFCASVDEGFVCNDGDDPYRRLLSQTLADRLAEATAEKAHEEVRKRLWAYAPDEQLTPEQLFRGEFQGIRPAVGYPSLPDQSINFLLDQALHFADIGVSLTQSGAMLPHASVSGLMIANPKARYFSVGKIGADQLRDYSLRRGLSLDETKHFLASNL
ncbi:MAG: 5-methyltetrahydrofolate--homocysteine methyltransferase, partial [Prevotellaceae bacterium]|nr:5-methyltetrahydrofolate--homocysteine methyltransferase [Prevotellaceae bacterium]